MAAPRMKAMAPDLDKAPRSGNSFPQDKCADCGYPLIGLPTTGRCPECGSEYSPDRIVLYGYGVSSSIKLPTTPDRQAARWLLVPISFLVAGAAIAELERLRLS